MKQNTKYLLTIGIFLLSVTAYMIWQPEGQQKLSKDKLKREELKKGREEYFFNLLKDPKTNSIPENIREKELKFARELAERKKNQRTTSSISYTYFESGTSNIGGRTRALAYDGRDTDVMIAGGVSGGLFKSTDGGESWYNVSDPSVIQSITSVAQDPSSQDTWYAVGGEISGNSAGDRGGTATFYGAGLYKSTDNGENWTFQTYSFTGTTGGLNTYSKDGTADTSIPTSFNNPFRFVNKVAVDPTNGNVYLASSAYGILRSEDGANTFLKIQPTDFSYQPSFGDVVVTSTGTVIATLSRASGGVFRSDDDGDTWETITPTGFPTGNVRTLLAIAPSDEDIVYAYSSVSTSNYDLFQIDLNGGGTTSDTDYSSMVPNYGGSVGTLTQGSYNMVLAVKPDDANFVVIGATNLYRIADITAGSAPVQNDGWIGGYSGANNVSQYDGHHPDQHSFFFDPNTPNTAWSGHDGGLSKTTDITATGSQDPVTWVDKNLHYNVAQYYHMAIPKDNGNMSIMGGTQDNGTLFQLDATLFASDATDGSSGDGAYAFFGTNISMTSSQNGNTLRMDYSSGNTVDIDFAGFRNWTRVKPSAATGFSGDVRFIHPFVLDPNDDDYLYYPDGNTIFRQDQVTSLANFESDQATGWTAMTGTDDGSGNDITALAVTTSPANTLYFGTSGSAASKIYKLENAHTAAASTSPTDITPATTNWPTGGYVHNIAINPEDGDEIIVVLSNYNIVGVFHTDDGGSTWSEIEGDLIGSPGPSIRSAAIHTYGGNTCYVLGTSIGLYATSTLNGSSTVWTQQSPTGIGNTIVASVAARNSDGALAVGTHGRGAFIAVPTSSLSSPTVTSFSPESGEEADVVTITGTNFEFVSGVEFNGTNAPFFTVNSTTEIEATVPPGATTGQISVITAGGTASSSDDFIIFNTVFRSGAWTNGEPTTGMNAKIEDNYVSHTEGAFECDLLYIDAGYALTINGDSSISISGNLVNWGTIEVLDTSSFVQTAASPTNSGTGRYSLTREGDDNSVQYNYWSSPVQNTNIDSVFGATGKWFYVFDATAQDWAVPSTSDTLEAGLGFIATGTSSTPSTIDRVFYDSTGYNSGDITQTLYYSGSFHADSNWHLVGNPYPSGLDVASFLGDNNGNLEDGVYLWSSDGNDIVSTAADYVVINEVGTVTPSASGGEPSSAVISAGQGFVVQSSASGNITFSNSQRTATSNTFQRVTSDMERIWLGVEKENGASNAILLGFLSDAEEGKDRYDARKFSGNEFVSFYSVLGTANCDDDRNCGKFAIQGLPHFTDEAIIPIGIEAKQAGEFTFSIKQIDGIKEEIGVYLYDRSTDAITSLRDGDYKVNLAQGEYNNRFELRLIDARVTSLEESLLQQMGIKLFSANQQIHVQFNKPEFAQSELAIYSLTGQKLYQARNEQKLDVAIPVRKSGIYIVRLKNQKGLIGKKLFVE